MFFFRIFMEVSNLLDLFNLIFPILKCILRNVKVITHISDATVYAISTINVRNHSDDM